jgi:Rieske Fe-S protein
MKIRIEIPESGGRSALSKVMAVRQKQIKDRREKAAAVVDSSEEEEEGGTALVRRKRNTGNTTGTSQVQVPVKVEEVVDKSDKKGLATEEIEAENKREKEMVVDSSEEEEEEEDTTPLIRRKRNMGKTTETSQVQVQVPVKVGEVMDKGKETAVEVTETSVEDKARVEAIIRRGLENGKAVVGEEPQTQIGGSVSEILELVAPKKLMIFELKWPTEVPPLELLEIKQALPEVLEEEEEESQTVDKDTGKKKNRGCNIV